MIHSPRSHTLTLSGARRVAPAILLALSLALLAACASPAGAPAPDQAAPAVAPTDILTWTPQPSATRAAPPTAPSVPSPTAPAVAAPTASPTVAPGDYVIGARDFILRLNADGSMLLGEPAAGRADFARAWRGAWRPAGAELEARFNATADGAPMLYAVAFHFQVAKQQVDITDYSVNDVLYDRDDLQHTLGSGQRHPLIRVLNKLLTNIHYLNYTYPAKDDDLYTDFVRRAVVNFQEVEGLTPDGVADQATWLQLLSPALQQPMKRTDNQVVIGQDVVNVRAGPATNYAVLDRRYLGEALDVVGKRSGVSPETTWYQICCVDREYGWLRSDTGQFQGVIGSVPEVLADQLPPTPAVAPTPTAAPAQPVSYARRGQPLLENLPARTADGKPVIYLTFDDGPNADGAEGGYTQQVVNLFKKANGHTTFFNVGRSVATWPQLVRVAAAEKHYIANHTWDHQSLEGMTREQFLDEVERTRQAILKAAGDLFSLDKDVHYLRPPYGATDVNTRRFAADLGYAVVMWDVDPQDWRRPGVQEIADHVVAHAFPGAIILMHDGGGERTQSVAALEIILRELSAKGYVFYSIFGN